MGKLDMTEQEKTQSTTASKSSTLMVLGIVCGILTITLTIICVMFGVFVMQQKINEPAVTDYNHFNHYNVNSESAEILSDRKHKIQKQVIRDVKGNLSSIVVFNFHMRIISAYLPAYNKCFLIGGIYEILSFDVFDSLPAANSMRMVKNTFTLNDMNPVSASELLTDDLAQYCTSNNIYWLERVQKEHRKKRVAPEVCPDIMAKGCTDIIIKTCIPYLF